MKSVNSYMVRLRQLAVPSNFGPNLENELMRAFVFGCGIDKVEELMSSNDVKTLKFDLRTLQSHSLMAAP